MMSSPRAKVCTSVLSLPPWPAGITTPRRISQNRMSVMPHSRTSTTIVTHHHSSPMIDSPTNAMPVSALSAIGSAILPKSVTRSCLRARSPSILSVIIATAKSA